MNCGIERATVRIVLPEALLNAGPRSMTSATVLNLLQETLPQARGSSAAMLRYRS